MPYVSYVNLMRQCITHLGVLAATIRMKRVPVRSLQLTGDDFIQSRFETRP